MGKKATRVNGRQRRSELKDMKGIAFPSVTTQTRSLRVGKTTYRLLNVLVIYTVSLPIASMAPTVHRLSSPSFLALGRFAFPFIQDLVLRSI